MPIRNTLKRHGVPDDIADSLSSALQQMFNKYAVDMRTILEIVEARLRYREGALFSANYDTALDNLPTVSGIYPVFFDSEIYEADIHLQTAGTTDSIFAIDYTAIGEATVELFQLTIPDGERFITIPFAEADVERIFEGGELQCRVDTAGTGAAGPSVLLKLREQ